MSATEHPRAVEARTVWACCESRIGPPCAHRTTAFCARCGKQIWLAEDGAWDDEKGACGCQGGEHEPEDPTNPQED